ncbi:MAG: FHA domain-containing protein [Kofleriaceae bacterium]
MTDLGIGVPTKRDARTGWTIEDPVLSLRKFGQQTRYALGSTCAEWTIGTSPECSIRLEDATGLTSRRHARLSRMASSLVLEEWQSKNGIRLDGERRLSFDVSAGSEIGIGATTLVAESRQLITFHALLARLIGWSSTRAREVDHALRAARDLANQRAVLALVGVGDLVPLARRIHDFALGDHAPFVVCSSSEAFESALTGTLCFIDELPFAVRRLVLRGKRPETSVMFCTQSDASVASTYLGRTSQIVLPTLAERPEDLDRLIRELTGEAVAALGAAESAFRDADHRRIREAAPPTLTGLAELTRRLVALRNWGLTHGAARLGISRVALAKWMRRRSIPI